MNSIFVYRPVFSHKYSIKQNHEYKYVTIKPGISKTLDLVKVVRCIKCNLERNSSL